MRKYFLFIFTLICFISFSITSSYAAFPEEYSEAKDITLSDKTFNINDNKVTVSYTRPAQPLKPFQITLKFEKENIKDMNYTTNMMMNMGEYKYTPIKNQDIYMITPVVLPKCGSGRTLWYGQLDITYNSNKKDKLIFFYNVK